MRATTHTLRLAAVVLFAMAAACGDDRSMTASPAPTDESTSTIAAEMTSTTDQATTTSTAAPIVGTGDPADVYLSGTTEVYRRTLPDGQDFVVRMSTASYAAVFGITWTAPTGSAEMCLGDHAIFYGVPGDIGPWGSAWVAAPWYVEPNLTEPAMLATSMLAAVDDFPTTEFLLLRVAADVVEVVVSSTHGTELDRSPVLNGVVMVIAPPVPKDGLGIAVVTADGELSAPMSLTYMTRETPAECGPGEQPVQGLPAPGQQPADPGAAEAQIRQRFAMLVDATTPFDQKPSDLLDDNTGVADAIDRAYNGQFGDLAATSKYTIDELVFIQPNEAFFFYTIDTATGAFEGRIGHAVLDGGVWQFTRATLCQDLAFAQAPCSGNPVGEQLPPDPAWDAEWDEWMRRAMLYNIVDGCPPLSQC